jgi:hypothetical protein
MQRKGFIVSDVAPLVELGDDGIWRAGEQEPISYPQEGNDRCFEIEDKSFWFQHRNACIVELVKGSRRRRLENPIHDEHFSLVACSGLVVAGDSIPITRHKSHQSRRQYNAFRPFDSCLNCSSCQCGKPLGAEEALAWQAASFRLELTVCSAETMIPKAHLP